MWVFDGAAAAVLFALSAISLATITPAEQELFKQAPDAWAYVAVAGQTLPIAFRRIRPTTALAIVLAAFIFDRGVGYPATTASVGLAFAFHSLGSELPLRRSLRVGLPLIAALVAFTTMGVYYDDSVTWSSVVLVGIVTLAPLLLGREVNERRRYLTELEERAAQLERDREAQAHRAVREERARIARELHDVVAHEMTVMTIQAAAARRVIATNPEQAAVALSTIETSGHEALAEMRRLLGLLRHQATSQELQPQPGLARIDGLIEQMEESGLPVEVVIEGEARPLPAGVDLNVYRIIQESLTNTLKHGGPGAKAVVRLDYQPEQILVEIADDGRGSAATRGNDGATGHGIVGMRERVAMLGGSLHAGPRTGGGFVVRATIAETSP